MDNVIKHLKRKSKQIISLMLAFAILTENPLSAYASAASPNIATSSNADDGDYIDKIDDRDLGKDPDYIKSLEDTVHPSYFPQPVVDASTIPDEIEMDEDDLDEILGAGANCIDDFDPDNLEPLTSEQIEAALNPEPAPYDPNLENVIGSNRNDVSTHVVGEVVIIAAIAAIMAIMWKVGSSAVTESYAEIISKQINSFANNFTSTNFNYTVKGVATKVLVTQQMFANLKNKLDSTSGSIALSEEDKQAFAYTTYALASQGSSGDAGKFFGYALSSFDTSSCNIKAIDGFKYYYFYSWCC